MICSKCVEKLFKEYKFLVHNFLNQIGLGLYVQENKG